MDPSSLPGRMPSPENLSENHKRKLYIGMSLAGSGGLLGKTPNKGGEQASATGKCA